MWDNNSLLECGLGTISKARFYGLKLKTKLSKQFLRAQHFIFI